MALWNGHVAAFPRFASYPEQTGRVIPMVRLTLDRFLASFEPAGLVRTGGAFQSPGYDRAERKLDIDVTTAVGGVKVEWVE